ncbi:hypothetical protein L579_4121 [Pantoea sp. AS-PWVM4]|nr:hypothetical protein L579_4121 [Pantoea sp. AS-PWVM4]
MNTFPCLMRSAQDDDVVRIHFHHTYPLDSPQFTTLPLRWMNLFAVTW